MTTTSKGEDWFHLVRQGDKNAFRQAFELFYRPVVYFAAQIIRDDGYAEDIVSETFRKAWEARTRFESARHLENFLYLVTRNGCISFLRSDRSTHTTEKEWTRLASEEQETHNPADLERVQTELISLVYEKLEKLPGGDILRMAYLEGKSTKEIAKELNITENTVYITKSRSLKSLRSMLSKTEWMFFVLFFIKW